MFLSHVHQLLLYISAYDGMQNKHLNSNLREDIEQTLLDCVPET